MTKRLFALLLAASLIFSLGAALDGGVSEPEQPADNAAEQSETVTSGSQTQTPEEAPEPDGDKTGDAGDVPDGDAAADDDVPDVDAAADDDAPDGDTAEGDDAPDGREPSNIQIDGDESSQDGQIVPMPSFINVYIQGTGDALEHVHIYWEEQELHDGDSLQVTLQENGALTLTAKIDPGYTLSGKTENYTYADDPVLLHDDLYSVTFQDVFLWGSRMFIFHAEKAAPFTYRLAGETDKIHIDGPAPGEQLYPTPENTLSFPCVIEDGYSLEKNEHAYYENGMLIFHSPPEEVTLNIRKSFTLHFVGDVKLFQDGTQLHDGDQIIPAASGQWTRFQYEVEPGFKMKETDELRFAYDQVTIYIELLDTDDDGTVTVEAIPRPTVTLKIEGETPEIDIEEAVTITYNGQAIRDGDDVYLDMDYHDAYTVTFADGYTYGETSEARVDEYNNTLSVTDIDRDGTVILRVCFVHKVVLRDPYGVLSWLDSKPVTTAKGRLMSFMVPSGYPLTVENGTIEAHTHRMEGEEIICCYDVVCDGTGDMIVTVGEKGELDVSLLPVKYTGPWQEAIIRKDDKAIKGNGDYSHVVLLLNEGYTISMTGGVVYSVHENGSGSGVYFTISPNYDADELVVKVEKIHNSARLVVKGGNADALMETDPYGSGEAYAVDGSTLSDGQGYILVKNGYTPVIESGGILQSLSNDGGFGGGRGAAEYGYVFKTNGTTPVVGSELYIKYCVVATAGTVHLRLQKSDPHLWGRVQLTSTTSQRLLFGYGNAKTFMDGTDAVIIPPNWFLQVMDHRIATIGGGKVVRAYRDAENYYRYYVKPDGTIKDGDVTVITLDVMRGEPVLTAEADQVKKGGNGKNISLGVESASTAQESLIGSVVSIMSDSEQAKTVVGVTPVEAEKILAAADESATITASLTVNDSVSAADENAINSFLSGWKEKGTVEAAADVSICVTAVADSGDLGQLASITKTGDMIGLAASLPEDLDSADKEFAVLRCHNGAVEVLPSAREQGLICFESDLFSAFALVSYTPSESSDSGSTGSVGGSATGSTGSRYSPETGDRNAPTVWAALLAFSAVTLTAVLGKRKRPME